MNFDIVALMNEFRAGIGLQEQFDDGVNNVYVFKNGEHRIIKKQAALVDYGQICGDIDSFSSHVARYFESSKTTITVSSIGIFAIFHPTFYTHHTMESSIPFFTDDLPPDSSMEYDEFLLYLDQHAGKISALAGDVEISEEELLESVRAVSFRESAEKSVEDTGTSTSVSMTTTARVDNKIKIKIPKTLIMDIRYGIREMETRCKFRLRITSELKFQLTHLSRDGAIESYLDRAQAAVQAALPDYSVLKGV